MNFLDILTTFPLRLLGEMKGQLLSAGYVTTSLFTIHIGNKNYEYVN